MTKNEVTGSNNVQLIGDVHGNVTIITAQPPQEKTRTRVKHEPAPPDALSPAQKHALSELLNNWVDLNNNLKKKQISPQLAWTSLNKEMDVQTYSHIKSIDFEQAKSFLNKKIAMLNGMKSARTKSNDWRNTRYRAIHARVRQNGWETWKNLHLMKTFQTDSLTMLDDDQLEKFYRTVMSKKST